MTPTGQRPVEAHAARLRSLDPAIAEELTAFAEHRRAEICAGSPVLNGRENRERRLRRFALLIYADFLGERLNDMNYKHSELAREIINAFIRFTIRLVMVF
ncbi:MAG: hypothetical protein U0401_01400 [Anaerolineae bacterium]